MGLKDIGETLPPGFRFYPSDEELVSHYLRKKIANEEVLKGTLVEIDLHTCEPWQLPEVAKFNNNEWYFFSFRDRKYATGCRTNRATTSGYWKATGKDRAIIDPNTRNTIGMRKTLVFYKNRAPNGIKTGWIMHEFRLEKQHLSPKEDWVLCRVSHKGRGVNSGNNNEDTPPHRTFDQTTTNTGGGAPPYWAAPPTTKHHAMPCGDQQASSSSNPSAQDYIDNQNQHTFDLALLNANCLQFLREEGNPKYYCSELIYSKQDEEDGFLWGMNFAGSRLGDGAPHHDLGDI
ncbi:hypothetical protein Nepgr_032620 [Nepenthes gracilis]|uniref:NAC domain-containing protein n=1 Tax=Nepenthes gracilis TaxID=150966 RepID=A0AAD3Y5W7_NEPGR|nr:hypothetical protein Nepgr_032620 [Nepenthes gracilis]